ncbi:tlde1 domain-containing protein [Ensifer sp. LBL]|uniref:tlde1 domain-containing protein n=1 Tax=Ensifer sp. LBL TaxID=2991056 RepID=UPI003D205600
MDHRNGNKKIKLHFDGKRLNATENGRYAGGWDGVAGMPGMQEPKYQRRTNEGPIPEGVYDVDQLQYAPQDFWERLASRMGGGKWRGLEETWGNSRAFLENKSLTDPATAHRDGFTIHGGDSPGSNGCIDLTSGMDSFADFYRNTGQSAQLNVSYPEYDPDKPGDGKATSETGGRWEPDGASSRRSFSLRDALRFWE